MPGRFFQDGIIIDEVIEPSAVFLYGFSGETELFQGSHAVFIVVALVEMQLDPWYMGFAEKPVGKGFDAFGMNLWSPESIADFVTQVGIPFHIFVVIDFYFKKEESYYVNSVLQHPCKVIHIACIRKKVRIRLFEFGTYIVKWIAFKRFVLKPEFEKVQEVAVIQRLQMEILCDDTGMKVVEGRGVDVVNIEGFVNQVNRVHKRLSFTFLRFGG